jgi:hypothetical protein
MTHDHASLVDSAYTAFIQGGVSIVVGACDRKRLPALARATGCRISSDRRRLTIFMSATQGAQVLRCIRDNGAIAVVFSEPSTHHTIQLKGIDAEVGGLKEGDLQIVEDYRSAFARELDPLGFDEVLIRSFLSCPPADIVSLTFTPAEAYSQTPGPSAGEPLRMQP